MRCRRSESAASEKNHAAKEKVTRGKVALGGTSQALRPRTWGNSKKKTDRPNEFSRGCRGRKAEKFRRKKRRADTRKESKGEQHRGQDKSTPTQRL